MPMPLDETFDVGEDGQLADRRRAAWLWSQIKLYAGRRVRIRVSAPKRSTRANAYYWGVVLDTIRRACMDAGQPVSAEELHHHFKALYLPARTFEVMGIDHVMPGSTAQLDSTSFADYIEAIKQDEQVLALGCYIPDPDEYEEREGAFRSYAIAEP